MKACPAYLTVGTRTWCDLKNRQEGREALKKSGVTDCSYKSVRKANEAAMLLRPYFATGTVRVNRGVCPHLRFADLR